MLTIRHIKTLLLAVSLLLAVGACQKETPSPDAHGTAMMDAWLLNEGSWNCNNSELSHLCTADGSIANNCFADVNHRLLGDTGQDIVIYGGKMYVSVFESGTIEVLNPSTGACLHQIAMGDRQPRYIACTGGKLYVSCYSPHSVIRIDTASLAIEATCPLSRLRPEGLCLCGDNLYVCSSWENKSNGGKYYDSVLCVVALNSFTETGTIAVGLNPNYAVPLDSSRLAVCYWGDHTQRHRGGVCVVDATTGEVRHAGVAATSIDTYRGDIYGLSYDYYRATPTQFFRIDGTTLQSTSILQDYASAFKNPFHISVDPSNGDLYVTDAQYFIANGDLYRFGADGSLRWKSEATTGPTKVVFARR